MIYLFSSPSCGPCKQLKATLKSIDLTVDKEINIMDGEHLDFIMKHRVRGVPTLLLVDNQGDALDVEVGYSGDLDRLRTFFKHRDEVEGQKDAG